MIYLKSANTADIKEEYEFISRQPADENGFINNYAGISFEDFEKSALPEMINFSKGIGLPEGYVAETFYFLWTDEEGEKAKIAGEFHLRHHLTPALENYSGHVGQFIAKEYRGRGYCTKGLGLLIEEAKKIVPENELYLHCNSDNEASLKVMLKNGGVIHHQNKDGFFVRIKLR